MNFHFKNLSLGLSMESNDVRMIGICGICGIGKTTIAGYVYNQISWGFECSSFLENVRDVHKSKGQLRLQNQLLNDILDGANKKKKQCSPRCLCDKKIVFNFERLLSFFMILRIGTN